MYKNIRKGLVAVLVDNMEILYNEYSMPTLCQLLKQAKLTPALGSCPCCCHT